IKVIRYVRPKLSCRQCERIVQAPAPSRPIARGLAGPGLLAHELVSKYADHLPLYRQSEIYARQGVELERAPLADWVGGTSRLLEPLVEALPGANRGVVRHRRNDFDVNAAERSLRGVALGPKNYLFAGSGRGGERAPAIYSLIGSAKVNDLDPEAYLRDVLTRVAAEKERPRAGLSNPPYFSVLVR